jgi:hypothetical protein
MDPRMTEAAGPVFVAGSPRSGTSALSWAIAAHPLYWTSSETHFFYYLLNTPFLSEVHARSSGAGAWLDIEHVSRQEFLQHIGIGLDRMMHRRSGGLQWVDGSPENLLVGAELLGMFPSAQVVNVVRAPESVCLSMLMSGFSEDWATDIEAAIRTWRHYVEKGLELAEAYPDRVLLVRQEEMAHVPQEVAARLGERLRLEEVDKIASFLTSERINSSSSRASLIENSPFRNDAPPMDPTEYQNRFAARVADETYDLAIALGYRT